MNSTDLIAALKIHGSFPASNDLFSPSDFLVLFNHQLKIDLTPMMMRLNEDYFLQYKTFDVVEGQKYRIPRRAVGSKLRDIKLIDNSGNETPLARLYEEDRGMGKSGFYVFRNSIELSSEIKSGTLRLCYFGRPSTLVETSACAKISDIDYDTGIVTVESAPSTFANGVYVDFVQNCSPFDLVDLDVELASISGTTLTFASVPSELEIGDWVCLATESPIPMLPDELHPVLVQSALCKSLSSKKDKQWENEMEVLKQNKEDAINMLDPRVENNSAKFRTGNLLNYFSSRRF